MGTNIYNTYDSSKYLLEIYEKYMPEKLEGGENLRADLELMFGAFGIAGKISLMIKVLTELEIFDDLLSPITVADSDPTAVEIWADGDWGEGSIYTQSQAGEYRKRTLTIPKKTITHQIKINKTEMKKILTEQLKGNSATASAIESAIIACVEGYARKLRQEALKAMFITYDNTKQDPTLPIFYRDTTTYDLENQVIPPRNGELTFETAEGQEHHIWQNGVDLDFLEKLRDLVIDKGGNPTTTAVIANKNTWRKLRDTLTVDEYRALQIKNEIGLSTIFDNPLDYDLNISLSNADMKDDYWLCLDLSQKIIKRRTSPLMGEDSLNVSFNTIPQAIKVLGNGASSEQIRAMAENSLTESYNNGGLKFEDEYVGFGVINAGAGAVGYTATGATGYVVPSFT